MLVKAFRDIRVNGRVVRAFGFPVRIVLVLVYRGAPPTVIEADQLVKLPIFKPPDEIQSLNPAAMFPLFRKPMSD